CSDGQMCNFCHMPHSQAWLDRAAALREQRRAERRQKSTTESRRTVQTYSDVRSWEGGEPHLEPGSLQALHPLGWETGEAQTLFVPEVPDRIPMFEGKGKTKNKTWKGSQKGGTPKGSQGKKGYKDATGEARGQLENRETSTRTAAPDITIHGTMMQL
ncbi:unnamed protein product, partial [Durusdinium trenchii]